MVENISNKSTGSVLLISDLHGDIKEVVKLLWEIMTENSNNVSEIIFLGDIGSSKINNDLKDIFYEIKNHVNGQLSDQNNLELVYDHKHSRSTVQDAVIKLLDKESELTGNKWTDGGDVFTKICDKFKSIKRYHHSGLYMSELMEKNPSLADTVLTEHHIAASVMFGLCEAISRISNYKICTYLIKGNCETPANSYDWRNPDSLEVYSYVDPLIKMAEDCRVQYVQDHYIFDNGQRVYVLISSDALVNSSKSLNYAKKLAEKVNFLKRMYKSEVILCSHVSPDYWLHFNRKPSGQEKIWEIGLNRIIEKLMPDIIVGGHFHNKISLDGIEIDAYDRNQVNGSDRKEILVYHLLIKEYLIFSNNL